MHFMPTCRETVGMLAVAGVGRNGSIVPPGIDVVAVWVPVFLDSGAPDRMNHECGIWKIEL